MDYTALCDAVATTTENTFSADDYARFAQLTEQKIYNAVQFPALRKNMTGTAAANNPYLSLPTDFLYTHSLAVSTVAGGYEYLLPKDVNFVRECYPFPAVVGKPKYYAIFDQNTFILGPTPDVGYTLELHFGYYPESIVTAGTTWLGDFFDSALFNGMLVEAARFMKAEEDILALYTRMFNESMTELKTLADGKLRQDSYRAGQVRVPVT